MLSKEDTPNKAVVRAMLMALERGDFTALEEHPGLYETRKYHPLWQKAFEELTYTVERMVEEGDFVSTRVIMHGTHVGTFMGAAPTGQELSIGVLLMDRIVDGKIMEHWANADWVSVLIKLGILTPLPGD